MALPVMELLDKAGDELGAKRVPSTCAGQGAASQDLSRVSREVADNGVQQPQTRLG